MTDKTQVLDWLSEVVHPAREDRSLVELGMVDSIEIAEGRIEVTLAFPKRPDPAGGLTGDARVLLHCFSGSAELGKQYVRMGATLSIAGPVTYKNNKKTVSVVREIPIDFLLVETDSPYLSPVPMRGKPNTPPNVEYTARKVAEIKEMTFEEVAAKTNENAMRFYGI